MIFKKIDSIYDLCKSFYTFFRNSTGLELKAGFIQVATVLITVGLRQNLILKFETIFSRRHINHSPRLGFDHRSGRVRHARIFKFYSFFNPSSFFCIPISSIQEFLLSLGFACEFVCSELYFSAEPDAEVGQCNEWKKNDDKSANLDYLDKCTWTRSKI